MKILLDTNIVLRNSLHLSQDQKVVQDAIVRLVKHGDIPCIAVQTIYEVWVVATRPANVNGLGLTTAETQTEVKTILQAFKLLPEPSDLMPRWFELCTRYEVKGRAAHDTRLVALMLAHGINQILTLNPNDFSRYAEITCLAPTDI